MALLRSSRAVTHMLLRPMACMQPAAAGSLVSCSTRAYATAREDQGPGTVASMDEQPQTQQQQQSTSKPSEEWLEVVDKESGQTYYWNQKTGETTELGEPRPNTRFREQGFSGAHEGPFQEGWREPLEPDRTQIYAFTGIVAGIFLGWATQYMH